MASYEGDYFGAFLPGLTKVVKKAAKAAILPVATIVKAQQAIVKKIVPFTPIGIAAKAIIKAKKPSSVTQSVTSKQTTPPVTIMEFSPEMMANVPPQQTQQIPVQVPTVQSYITPSGGSTQIPMPDGQTFVSPEGSAGVSVEPIQAGMFSMTKGSMIPQLALGAVALGIYLWSTKKGAGTKKRRR